MLPVWKLIHSLKVCALYCVSIIPRWNLRGKKDSGGTFQRMSQVSDFQDLASILDSWSQFALWTVLFSISWCQLYHLPKAFMFKHAPGPPPASVFAQYMHTFRFVQLQIEFMVSEFACSKIALLWLAVPPHPSILIPHSVVRVRWELSTPCPPLATYCYQNLKRHLQREYPRSCVLSSKLCNKPWVVSVSWSV